MNLNSKKRYELFPKSIAEYVLNPSGNVQLSKIAFFYRTRLQDLQLLTNEEYLLIQRE